MNLTVADSGPTPKRGSGTPGAEARHPLRGLERRAAVEKGMKRAILTTALLLALPVGVAAQSAPDLVVLGPNVTETSVETGETFAFIATVTNDGDAQSQSAATTVRYLRSTDAEITASDTEEGTDAVRALRINQSYGATIFLTAPSTAGTYHYGACVDAVAGESDTTNNCSSAVSVTVSDGGGGGGGAAVGGGGGDPSVPDAPASLTAKAGDEEVALVWKAPADDGGAPVTGYEYRYAAGNSVPEDTPWQSAELNLERTVTGLTNGQRYAFEVRAGNRVGEGEARGATATPAGRPGAPASLTATAGDGQVVLAWRAPADDGGAPVTGYQYRYAAGTAVPEGRLWRSVGLILEQTVTGLTNGQRYAFQVRARNRVGRGAPRGSLATPAGRPGPPASLTGTAGDGEVALIWSAPADNGGAPLIGYEYRYAAGAAVPAGTLWQSAPLNHQLTVIGLTNGQQYAFEVRARNRVGEGAARGALATPVGRPSAPASLTATAGDQEVALAWAAPLDDGGTQVTSYEYRYAAGGAVPVGTPWRSAGLTLEHTITGLTNGQRYTFEVRARNRVGEGEERGATATPVGRPGAPATLTATAGDAVVLLAWSAPGDDGGTPVTGYEYRYAPGEAVPADISWREADGDLTVTVTGLENETRYTFEVRARNRVGPGEVTMATALPLRLRAELFSSTAAAEGEAVAVGVRRSGGLAFAAHAAIGVTDNALPGVSATEEGRSDGLGRHRLEFAVGQAEATVTVTIAFDGERREDRVLTATLDSAATEVDGVTRPYEPVAPELVVPVAEGDAGLSVADARAQGESAVLAFTVSMDRTRDVAVQVDSPPRTVRRGPERTTRRSGAR